MYTVEIVEGQVGVQKENGGLWASLRDCAQVGAMTLPGLLLRVIWESVALVPRVLGGETPRKIKMKFLPLAAMYSILARKAPPEAAEEAVRRTLFAAAMDENRVVFAPAMKSPGVGAITANYEQVHKGPGRHQRVRYEQSTGTAFQFAVTDCIFVRSLRELDIEFAAVAMCDADREFWGRLLQGSGVQFSKSERTIARGGSCCRSLFAAGVEPRDAAAAV
ncbi:MAG: hypothetical protein C0404_01270 [Verrucomicrobia bacterium]|nr:hypothetical protein [Verrucomicrobiota bacterium]